MTLTGTGAAAVHRWQEPGRQGRVGEASDHVADKSQCLGRAAVARDTEVLLAAELHEIVGRVNTVQGTISGTTC